MSAFHLYLFECKFHFLYMLFNFPGVIGMEITNIRLTSCYYKPVYTFHKLVSEVIQELHQEVNEEASLELTQAYDITKQWKVSPLISCLSSLE